MVRGIMVVMPVAGITMAMVLHGAGVAETIMTVFEVTERRANRPLRG